MIVRLTTVVMPQRKIHQENCSAPQQGLASAKLRSSNSLSQLLSAHEGKHHHVPFDCLLRLRGVCSRIVRTSGSWLLVWQLRATGLLRTRTGLLHTLPATASECFLVRDRSLRSVR